MKFAYLAILGLLCGCSTTKATESYYNTEQKVVDTSIDAALGYLKDMGYDNPLITGNRSEDCEDDHAVMGYGVILKVFERSGQPTAISGVICIDWDGNFSINFDRKQ